MTLVKYQALRGARQLTLRFDPLRSRGGPLREIMRLMCSPGFFVEKKEADDDNLQDKKKGMATGGCQIVTELLDQPLAPGQSAPLAEILVEFNDGSKKSFDPSTMKVGEIFKEIENYATRREHLANIKEFSEVSKAFGYI